MGLDWLEYWWPLALIGGVGLLTAASCYGWIFFQCISVLRQRLKRRSRPVSESGQPGATRRPVGFFRLAAALTAGSLGLALFSLVFALLSQIYAYRALTAIELVGELQCEEKLGPRQYLVRYTPIESGRRLESHRVELRGEQWVVGADILRWRPFMGYLGFHASYKVTRLEGRYLTAADQRSEPITAHDLGGGTDTFWLTLYRQEQLWPYSLLIDSVYGSAVYQFLEPDSAFEIFIGRDGLLTRPKEQAQMTAPH